MSGSTCIPQPVARTVSGGNASASYTLPGGSAAKTYTIEAAYTSGPTGSFADSSDNTKTMTTNLNSRQTTAAYKTVTLSTTNQTVTLTATVTSGAATVNQ